MLRSWRAPAPPHTAVNPHTQSLASGDVFPRLPLLPSPCCWLWAVPPPHPSEFLFSRPNPLLALPARIRVRVRCLQVVSKPPGLKFHPAHRFEGGSVLSQCIGHLRRTGQEGAPPASDPLSPLPNLPNPAVFAPGSEATESPRHRHSYHSARPLSPSPPPHPAMPPPPPPLSHRRRRREALRRPQARPGHLRRRRPRQGTHAPSAFRLRRLRSRCDVFVWGLSAAVVPIHRRPRRRRA